MGVSVVGLTLGMSPLSSGLGLPQLCMSPTAFWSTAPFLSAKLGHSKHPLCLG